VTEVTVKLIFIISRPPLIRCWQYYVLWNFNSSFIANCFP